jgi:cell division protein FtsQ
MNWRSARKSSANTRVRAPRPPDVEASEGASGAESSDGSAVSWFWIAAKFVLGTALVLGTASAIAFSAYRFLVTSSRFAIDRAEVSGSRRFTEEQVLALSGTRVGANLFALDVAAAERALTTNAWIISARVTRKLPSTLVITVTERVPAALAVLDGGLFLLTRDGHTIKAVESGDETDFPIVTGLSLADLNTDRTRATELVSNALAVQREYERLPMSKIYPTEEIHLEEDGKLSLVVGTKGMTLYLGKESYRQKLLMASRVVGNLRARGQVPAVVFLDNSAHPERVVARMR